MAQCKDCIHEKVCLALIKHGLPWNDGKYLAEKLCFEFLNKADVVPSVEVEQLKRNLAQCENGYSQELHLARCQLADAKSEVARGIFEEIEDMLLYFHYGIYTESDLNGELDKIKKKYTESEGNK